MNSGTTHSISLSNVLPSLKNLPFQCYLADYKSDRLSRNEKDTNENATQRCTGIWCTQYTEFAHTLFYLKHDVIERKHKKNLVLTTKQVLLLQNNWPVSNISKVFKEFTGPTNLFTRLNLLSKCSKQVYVYRDAAPGTHLW